MPLIGIVGRHERIRRLEWEGVSPLQLTGQSGGAPSGLRGGVPAENDLVLCKRVRTPAITMFSLMRPVSRRMYTVFQITSPCLVLR